MGVFMFWLMDDETGAPGWLSRLSVKLLISAQVMISRFVGSSTEPAWESLSPFLSAPPPLAVSLSLLK